MGGCFSNEFQELEKKSLALQSTNESVIKSEEAFEDAYAKFLSIHFSGEHDQDAYQTLTALKNRNMELPKLLGKAAEGNWSNALVTGGLCSLS